jgi:membrane protein
MKPATLFGLLRESGERWLAIRAPTLGAAMAYYTTFSIAPLLVIAITLAEIVYGRQAAEGELARNLEHAIGRQQAEAIQELLKITPTPAAGVLTTVISIAVLLFGASGVFTELQQSLNRVWGVETRSGRGIAGVVRDRFLSISMVLGTCFLLLTSLILTTALAALTHLWPPESLPGGATLWHLLDIAVTLSILVLLFAMILKFVPDVSIRWKDVWLGAGITAFLFLVGKYLLGLYLALSSLGSAHGAVGSLVALLFWVYYSGQIFFFGAVMTRVVAQHAGRKIEPTRNAVLIETSGTAPPL